ncbi:MAG: hypothetical protein JO112_22715 [Planctomycetes bacterium]|nr:hypothetical protein [Planctomycetota bacterium]
MESTFRTPYILIFFVPCSGIPLVCQTTPLQGAQVLHPKLASFFEGHQQNIRCITQSRDGWWVASADEGGEISLWEADRGVRRWVTHYGSQPSPKIVFSPDGCYLAAFVKSERNQIGLWDVFSGKKKLVIDYGDTSILALAFSADGQQILAGGNDRIISFWDVKSGHLIKSVAAHDHAVFSLALSEDGKQLASGSLGEVKIWDPETGRQIQNWKFTRWPLVSIAFSPDGHHLAVADSVPKAGPWQGSLALFCPKTGKVEWTLQGNGQGKSFACLAFHRSGKCLFAIGSELGVEEYDPTTGRGIGYFQTMGLPGAMALSPDGKALLVGFDQTISTIPFGFFR